MCCTIWQHADLVQPWLVSSGGPLQCDTAPELISVLQGTAFSAVGDQGLFLIHVPNGAGALPASCLTWLSSLS